MSGQVLSRLVGLAAVAWREPGPSAEAAHQRTTLRRFQKKHTRFNPVTYRSAVAPARDAHDASVHRRRRAHAPRWAEWAELDFPQITRSANSTTTTTTFGPVRISGGASATRSRARRSTFP